MRTRNLVYSAALAVVGLAASPALAQNPHLNTAPTITVNSDGTVTVTGTITGLGNKDVTVTLEVTGIATVVYYNPANHKPMGWNKEPVKSIAFTTIPVTLIKNGNASFSVTTAKPVLSPAPNPKWTVELQSLEITSVTVTVEQGGKVTTIYQK
jgi:hypothetical protein